MPSDIGHIQGFNLALSFFSSIVTYSHRSATLIAGQFSRPAVMPFKRADTLVPLVPILARRHHRLLHQETPHGVSMDVVDDVIDLFRRVAPVGNECSQIGRVWCIFSTYLSTWTRGGRGCLSTGWTGNVFDMIDNRCQSHVDSMTSVSAKAYILTDFVSQSL